MSLPARSWPIVVPEKLAACDVYIGCMPLRVPALAPKALPSVLAHLGVQHFYTLVQEPADDACMYYDFLPANPEDPLVIAAVLSGQRVKGIVQEKKLQRPPRQRCWWVGKTKTGNGLESARNFNTQWDSRLSLFHHDCRHHTNGLVHHLTGKKDVISRLDMLRSRKGLDVDPAPVLGDEDLLGSISITHPTLMVL
ncbi:unnamed protein product [Calypogeia fissa]